MRRIILIATLGWTLLAHMAVQAKSNGMAYITVSKDQKHVVQAPSGEKFIPWGFNYDHDEKGRLLEDYWEIEWPKVEKDFRDMKRLGANVVRIHLQLGKFVEGPSKPKEKALDCLAPLLDLAERQNMLAGFSVGKPVVIEETFALKCSVLELAQFIDRSKKNADGWLGFYWGKMPDELRGTKELSDLMTLGWLEFFEKRARSMK